DDVGLDREPVGHVGDVLDVDRHAVDRLDGNKVEGPDDVGAAVEARVILGGADLRRPGRDDQVLVGDGGADVRGGEAPGVQGLLGLGLGDGGPGLEVDADDADARQRLALDVLDAVDRGRQHALVDEHDPRFDLVGGHAVVLPDDGDDGDVDLGKDVRGHAVDA